MSAAATPRTPWARPLVALVGTQGLGMFNDSLLKMVVVLLIIGPRASETAQQDATFAAFLAYTLPYVLLSIPAGVIADAWSKRSVLVTLKLVEVGVMLLAGLALSGGGSGGDLSVLCLAGALGALGSPAKYGMLPEVLPEARLTRGNGTFLMVTWVATILGTGIAGLLLDQIDPAGRWQIGVLLAAVAVGGLLLILRAPHVPAAGSRAGILRTAQLGWSEIRSSRHLRLALQGSGLFWTLGALVQQDVVVFSKSALELSDTGKGLLQAGLAVGVGLGALACGLLTVGRLGVRWVHRGLSAMAVLLGLLALLEPDVRWAAPLLVLLGAASGFVVTPLNALAQGRSRPEHRGAVIAVLNVFVFSGILLGSVAGAALGRMGLSSTSILAVSAAAALLGAAWAHRARARLDEPLPAAAPRA